MSGFLEIPEIWKKNKVRNVSGKSIDYLPTSSLLKVENLIQHVHCTSFTIHNRKPRRLRQGVGAIVRALWPGQLRFFPAFPVTGNAKGEWFFLLQKVSEVPPLENIETPMKLSNIGQKIFPQVSFCTLCFLKNRIPGRLGRSPLKCLGYIIHIFLVNNFISIKLIKNITY